jgi:hypothetical protein
MASQSVFVRADLCAEDACHAIHVVQLFEDGVVVDQVVGDHFFDTLVVFLPHQVFFAKAKRTEPRITKIKKN